jgi:hypothetical protein
MKITKQILKQMIKEELEATQSVELAEDEVKPSNLTREINRDLNNALYNYMVAFKKDGNGPESILAQVNSIVKRIAGMVEKAQ